MRDPHNSRMSWSSAGWICLLAFLALPNCGLDTSGLALPRNFSPGSGSLDSAIFCDIEATRHCASAEEKAMGVRLAAAAVALNTGQTSVIGLDESPTARANCGGEPEAVVFQANFPEGLEICLNCGIIGSTFATATDACVTKCFDVVAPGAAPPAPGTVTFCQQRAVASTNLAAAAPSACFAGACSSGGTPLDGFTDPRREPEPVIWTDLIGASASGNDLTKTAATSVGFNAGAASEQWMARGDAYVEFAASETNLSHVIGLSEISSSCSPPCPDSDPSLTDINFAISLNYDGRFYVIESGALIMGPGANGSFGIYATGERFRVTLRDNSDGTATVSYSRLTAACTPGVPCAEDVFYTHVGLANYPMRVDTAFRETAATLDDVDVVRIR